MARNMAAQQATHTATVSPVGEGETTVVVTATISLNCRNVC